MLKIFSEMVFSVIVEDGEFTEASTLPEAWLVSYYMIHLHGSLEFLICHDYQVLLSSGWLPSI